MAIVWSCAVSVHVLLFGLHCGGLGKVGIVLFLNIFMSYSNIYVLLSTSIYLYNNYVNSIDSTSINQIY